MLLLLVGCGDEPAPPPSAPAPEIEVPAPLPVIEALQGPPGPTLLLAQAVLVRDGTGRPHAAPARLDLWRPGGDGLWTRTRLEDADSNVFHKAFVRDGSVLTIGADGCPARALDPDGRREIYYTPSGRNLAGASQYGGIGRSQWTGQTWTQRWVAASEATHAKEILAADLDGDGAVELHVSSDDQQELRRYDREPTTGRWGHVVLGPLEAKLLRLTWNVSSGVLQQGGGGARGRSTAPSGGRPCRAEVDQRQEPLACTPMARWAHRPPSVDATRPHVCSA